MEHDAIIPTPPHHPNKCRICTFCKRTCTKAACGCERRAHDVIIPTPPPQQVPHLLYCKRACTRTACVCERRAQDDPHPTSPQPQEVEKNYKNTLSKAWLEWSCKLSEHKKGLDCDEHVWKIACASREKWNESAKWVLVGDEEWQKQCWV